MASREVSGVHRILTARARGGIALAAAALMIVVLAAPVAADEHDFVLPAGIACADFDLALDIGPRVGPADMLVRDFYDKDGNLVRSLWGATGTALTFTNLGTGDTLQSRSNGAPSWTSYGPNGLMTVTAMAHQMLIWFPTDNPAGPWTRLYTGRVVFTIDANQTYTLLSTSGRYIDVCAALS
jgi:hypothetical protein